MENQIADFETPFIHAGQPVSQHPHIFPRRVTGLRSGFIAPIDGTGAQRWCGNAALKPWQYRVTIAIPCLGTPDTLPLVIGLLRQQSVRPYIVIVDTGSALADCMQLEDLRAEDLEAHYLRAHAYIHSSAPVTVAMDVAFALCRTEYLISTHSDVFLRRKDAVEWLLTQCSAECPVVGWEMSPREGPGKDKWQGVVSHTWTAWHMPTMRRIGATWSMERWWEMSGEPMGTSGWPDTESGINRHLKEHGITPKLLGPEPNFQLHRTEWFDHARSMTGVRLYAAATPYAPHVTDYAREAMAAARTRLVEWEDQSS